MAGESWCLKHWNHGRQLRGKGGGAAGPAVQVRERFQPAAGQRCPALVVAANGDRSCPQRGTGSKRTYFVRPVMAARELRDINPFEMPLLILAVLFL